MCLESLHANLAKKACLDVSPRVHLTVSTVVVEMGPCENGRCTPAVDPFAAPLRLVLPYWRKAGLVMRARPSS